MTDADRVEVGRVIKPHGLRGEVAVHLTSDVPDRLAAGTPVWVDGVASTVATSRDHQGRPLVRFAHVPDRTAAELLRGAVVEAAPVAAEELDTYLAGELIGVRVLDAGGLLLGTVSALIEMPAVAGYDLLEVTRPEGGTWLLPAADELVEAAEDDEGLHLVVGELPDGLLDVGREVGRAVAGDTEDPAL
jgi:16S rRNA processing protein RimM